MKQAKIVGASVKTLQRWDSGGIPTKLTPSNYRFYTDDDLRSAKKVFRLSNHSTKPNS